MKTDVMVDVDIENPKARQILEGARTAFLELGYEGTSTDEIVRRAGVSKGTVYNYFPNKQSLFRAFVELECCQHGKRIFKFDASTQTTESTLRELAHHFIELIVSSFGQNIYRLAVGEAQRFPDLARTFFNSGIDVGTRNLAQFLSAAVARGDLKIDDIELAAQQFLALCKADIFNKCLFGLQHSFTPEEIDRVANGAVDMFLRAYRP